MFNVYTNAVPFSIMAINAEAEDAKKDYATFIVNSRYLIGIKFSEDVLDALSNIMSQDYANLTINFDYYLFGEEVRKYNVTIMRDFADDRIMIQGEDEYVWNYLTTSYEESIELVDWFRNAMKTYNWPVVSK